MITSIIQLAESTRIAAIKAEMKELYFDQNEPSTNSSTVESSTPLCVVTTLENAILFAAMLTEYLLLLPGVIGDRVHFSPAGIERQCT